MIPAKLIGNQLITLRSRRRSLFYENLEPRRLLATLFSEAFESYAGTGFASSPNAGQLDSDLWRATGLSDGNGVFGGNHITGDFARGLASTPVTAGGVYAFEVGGNRVLGVQATASDMTPGTFGLKLINTTGSSVDEWTINYDIWFNNNEDRSSSVKLSYSTDNTNYLAVPALDFSTPELLNSAGWSAAPFQTTINVTVAAAGQLFFQWSFDDVSGAGSRDEIGLDKVIVSTSNGGSVGSVQSLDLRIVNYNIANSPQTSGGDGPFATIFSAIGQETRAGITRDIDLLVLQETDPTSLARLESIMDGLYPQNYARVIGNNFSGDYFGYIYNTSTLTLLETENVSGNYTRDPFRALFRPFGAPAGGSNFNVFNVHLNATNATTRETEATGIRARLDALGSSANAFVVGDLNIDSSSESSYSILTGSGTGQVFDPLNSPGNWHDNASFKSIHTQNPAGPMDDRFDFQLINDDVLATGGLEYVPGSYRAFGNNGSHTSNQAITTGNGASISVLAALATASDHLPVVVDYRYQVASIATARVFYNDSSFDTTNDLDARADKVPLLPGQTATFENYSSYVKGINGMVLEVNELPSVPTLANVNQFFQFRRGNSNNVASWSNAALPTSVTYRSNVAVDGTDQIFLTWVDQALKNTWLQVTVLSNSTTGLVRPVVYYFGNAVGETGNDLSNAIVNLSDLSLTRTNQTGFGSATIDNRFDFDRDGRVTLADVSIVRTNQSGFAPLILISPGSAGKLAEGKPDLGRDIGRGFTNGMALEFGMGSGRNGYRNGPGLAHDSRLLMDSKNELHDDLMVRDSMIEGYFLVESESTSRSQRSMKFDPKKVLFDFPFQTMDYEFRFFNPSILS